MEEEIVHANSCYNCNKPVRLYSKYCKHCGTSQVSDNTSADRDVTFALLAFYFLEFTICALLTFNENFEGLKCMLIGDGVMAGLAVFFSAYLYNDLLPILRWKSFSIKKLLIYLGIAICFSLIVQYSVNWLNVALFNSERYYYYSFANFKNPMLLMLLVTALSPALFEELAYRGFVMGGLLRIFGKREAIFIGAFAFSIIHLSMISIIWLLPFALLLGYVRIKENTIWYGVLIHFTFNAVSCLFEYYQLHLY